MKIKNLVRPDFPDVNLAFWDGFASLFSFGRRSQDRSLSFKADSDAKALERDWRVVGEGMKKAFDRANCR